MVEQLRPDEAQEMAMIEAAGVERGSADWDSYLKMYRGTMIHAWIGLGLSAREFREFNASWLRRVLRRTDTHAP